VTAIVGLFSAWELARGLGLPAPTQEQAAVIEAPLAPALVVAGAGAGKTETMAARVVWLVANGFVTPDQVLGLTFTRKAARQLADRVRTRMRRLAASGVLDEDRRAQVLAGEPTVLTYHAYAGRLVAEHGLRLPAEPGMRLLTETGAWQLAHRVVCTWDSDLDLDNVPGTVTGWVQGLAGELAEHLADPDELRKYADWFCAAVENAPRGKGQRAGLPQELLKLVKTQRARVALLPLVQAYAERKRADGVLDFADQLALAARLATEHPEVGAAERERYGVVLLDEYQDTGHSQRVLLRALFGAAGAGIGLPVTAVGDPCQSIYGWRGASAANLPRFTMDFPLASGEPARTYPLRTSFRNPPRVLALANAVSAPLRAGRVAVDDLVASDERAPADVRVALLPDVRAEVDWLAGVIAQAWQIEADAAGTPPTAAVLVRRRADMAAIAAALRARGLPVEVVGLGGLLDTPEVRDLVSALRLLVDPLAGTAAVRLLTGAHVRLGAADLAALWRRAKELSDSRDVDARTAPDAGAGGDHRQFTDTLTEAVPGEHAEQAGLMDAIDDPGPAEQYSTEGLRRIRRVAGELTVLRRRLGAPLPELVADVERMLRLDVETAARPDKAGRAHLDAFADVVADFVAESPAATLTALLDYLATAEQAEDGLEPGEVEVAQDRVQVLTVHAAKGLEWRIVAVPHLVSEVFPARKLSSSWLKAVTELPATLRGDAPDLPRLDLDGCADRREITDALAAHETAFDDRRMIEERRLLYVALTRAEHTLLVSGHWWGETGDKPREPSPFLLDVRATVPPGAVAHWAPRPAHGEANPVAAQARMAQWPSDPLGARRAAVEAGAALVREAMAAPPLFEPVDPDNWARDVDVLLAERAARHGDQRVVLPAHLSVSQLVELASDPAELARRLRRPVPLRPNPTARRGTAFHAWLERRFGTSRLLDLDELPGAADADAAPDTEFAALQQAFLAGAWGQRYPHDVEVPFEAEIDGILVRGRMDAVFADPDGGWTVVDWKTGALPDDEHLPAISVQLAAYRVAWAALSGVPLPSVRAAFHYVRQNVTIRPADLLDADGLRDLLRSVPVD
jgi:ATP-dependent DNA helicase UvrD/PcrA